MCHFKKVPLGNELWGVIRSCNTELGPVTVSVPERSHRWLDLLVQMGVGGWRHALQIEPTGRADGLHMCVGFG